MDGGADSSSLSEYREGLRLTVPCTTVSTWPRKVDKNIKVLDELVVVMNTQYKSVNI